MRHIKFALICLALALTGCASGIKYKDMSSSIATVAPDKGRIYFFRSASMVGAAIQPEIKLDGTVVGESKPGGFFYVDASAGGHEVSTTTEIEKKLTLMLDAGETKYVRTTISIGVFVGHVMPELVHPDEALAELPELSYTSLTPVSASAGSTAKQASQSTAVVQVTTENAPRPAAVPPVNQPIETAPAAEQPANQASEKALASVVPINPADDRPVPVVTSARHSDEKPVVVAVPVPAAMAPAEAPVARTEPKRPSNVFLPVDPPRDNPAPIQLTKVEFRLGESSVTVERMAKEQGCESNRGAGLLDRKGPIDVYRIACLDGRQFQARCEFRQCAFMSEN